MKKEENIDELIKQALTEEESEYLVRLGDQTLLEEGLGLFKGRRGWISIAIGIVMVLVMIGVVYSAFKFFEVNEVKELMIWGGAFFLGLFMITALKLWAWMQMDRNAVIRELKRLEVQVAALNARKS